MEKMKFTMTMPLGEVTKLFDEIGEIYKTIEKEKMEEIVQYGLIQELERQIGIMAIEFYKKCYFK
jgi:hypothetical protein